MWNDEGVVGGPNYNINMINIVNNLTLLLISKKSNFMVSCVVENTQTNNGNIPSEATSNPSELKTDPSQWLEGRRKEFGHQGSWALGKVRSAFLLFQKMEWLLLS